MSLTLEDVKKAFFDWRQVRPHTSARTPASLWHQVSLLIDSGHSKQRICSRLGINHAQIARHCSEVSTKTRPMDSMDPPQFIAVPAVQQQGDDSTVKINFMCRDKVLIVESNLSHLEKTLAAFKELL